MNTKKIEKYLLKLKDAFLDETIENKKMLDIYVKYIEGYASDDEIEEANYQLKQVFRSLGLGILVILPFSPISIPYVLKRAKEYNIDLIPDWYKALSKDKDEKYEFNLVTSMILNAKLPQHETQMLINVGPVGVLCGFSLL